MKRRLDRRWMALVVVAALAVTLWLTSGPPAATPTPSGAFAFAALGDAPYFWWEDLVRRPAVFQRARPDICHPRRRHFLAPAPTAIRRCSTSSTGCAIVIYTPGTTVDRLLGAPVGRFSPERLGSLRRIFFANPARAPAAAAWRSRRRPPARPKPSSSRMPVVAPHHVRDDAVGAANGRPSRPQAGRRRGKPADQPQRG
jgi:hypothetical protein